jgi:Cu/Ag efflux pump CusA
VHRGYDRLGERAVPRAGTAVVAGVALAAVGVLTVPLLAVSLMPTLREPHLLVEFDASAGVARPEVARITAAASAELPALPGVAQVGAHMGRGLQSDQVSDVNSAEISVHMDPNADYDATVVAVQDVVDGYPGLRREVKTFLGEQSVSLLTSPGEDLTVRIYGEDSSVLAAKAGEIRTFLAGAEGLGGSRQCSRCRCGRPCRSRWTSPGRSSTTSSPATFDRTVATLLSGLEVGSVFEEQKVFEVVVWGMPQLRTSADGVRNLLGDRPDGQGQVRVGDVADVPSVHRWSRSP